MSGDRFINYAGWFIWKYNVALESWKRNTSGILKCCKIEKRLLITGFFLFVSGNPRNKCVLQPGHSLMDWIRLGASGKDLTGVGAAAGHLSVS